MKLSIVMPAYNERRTIRDIVAAVLAVPLEGVEKELVIVDDGSTDETPEVLARYGERIRVVRQDNQGVAAARNAGIAVARGDLLAFLDSDDVWLPRKLDLQAARIETDPGLGLVHCGVDFTGTGIRLDGMEGSVALDILRLDRSVIVAHGSGVMVPRRVAGEVGGFDARMRVSEDWDFCYRVATRYRIGFVAEALVLHARHATGLQNDIARMEQGMLLALGKAFSDPAVQPLRRHTYGRLHRILSGCYFEQRQWRPFLRHFVKSVRWDWRNVGYFAAYPLRKLFRA